MDRTSLKPRKINSLADAANYIILEIVYKIDIGL